MGPSPPPASELACDLHDLGLRGLSSTRASERPQMSYRNAQVLTGLTLTILFLTAGCSSRGDDATVEIRNYPIDELAGIVTTDGVHFDDAVSSDGHGSLQITTAEPTTVQLYETGDIDVENARLVYEAKIRTEGLEGQAYLEMWCQFSGKGDFFSRALHAPISGTNDWTTQQTIFFLREGENPDNVRLNIVIKGRGKAWIDDIRLVRGPLS